jgi:hypothetical protein
MGACETQKATGAAINVKLAEGYGIRNSAGKLLTVTLHSSKCIE